MSGSEKKMRRFIKKYVLKTCPEALVYTDAKGNLYVTKGVSDTYPCVVAHMDQVQHTHPADFKVYELGDIIMAYSDSKKSQMGLGADDKNGIWVALKCLEKFDAIKLAFFVGEEIGCVGSSDADMSFFKDARFVLQCDRKGGHDLITEASCTELCSKDFAGIINPGAFGYKETTGMMTDVMTLKENGLGVCCVNISCGYYNPHTDEEVTKKSELLNCLAFVEDIIENCVGVYEHEYVPYTYSRYSKYDNDDYRGWWTNYKKNYGIDPQLPRRSDYADAYAFIEELLYYNYDTDPSELWPYVQSDLEADGLTYNTFLDIAYELLYDDCVKDDGEWKLPMDVDDDNDEMITHMVAS